MATEWWTSPSEAARRLELLTSTWNQIVNAALGRGTTPYVSAATADWIAAEVQGYREWRDQIEGWQWGVQWADELTDWTARANTARERVARELAARAAKDPSAPAIALPAPLTEWKEIGPSQVATAFAGLGGLVLGVGAIALVLLARRK